MYATSFDNVGLFHVALIAGFENGSFAKASLTDHLSISKPITSVRHCFLSVTTCHFMVERREGFAHPGSAGVHRVSESRRTVDRPKYIKAIVRPMVQSTIKIPSPAKCRPWRSNRKSRPGRPVYTVTLRQRSY